MKTKVLYPLCLNLVAARQDLRPEQKEIVEALRLSAILFDDVLEARVWVFDDENEDVAKLRVLLEVV